MSKAIIHLCVLLTLCSCAVGSGKFNCSEGAEGGICASASTIYHATSGELQENQRLTYFIEGKAQQTTLYEYNSLKNKAKTSKTHQVKPIPLIPISSVDHDKKVLRTSPTVMRVWIAPWVSKEDTLSMGELVFTDMEKKKWKYGKTTTTENSYLPIVKNKP